MKKITDEILKFAVDLGGSYDNPFSGANDTATVLRHKGTGKWFGILLEIPAYFFGGETAETGLDLKCPPDIGYLFKEQFDGIKPAYHMNKEHWITVRLDGSVPKDVIEQLISLSYDITAVKPKKRVNKD